jgi:hypothetical protein
MNKIIFFTLITLVLSIGITTVLPFSYSEELICPTGEIEVVRVTNPNSICIEQDTAQRWTQLGIAKIVGEVVETSIEGKKPAMSEPKMGQEIIETRIGSLTLDADYPTAATQKTLEDELFYQRAVQVYLLSLPAIAGAGIFDEFDEVGALSGDIVYWSDFMTSENVVATANRSVLYSLSFLDLSEGPVVIDVPGGLYGAVNNLYQQPVTDIGASGPDKGDGGKFLILPPEYDGEIPEDYFVAHSDTMQNFFLARGSAPNGDTSIGIQQIKEAKIYKLSEAENPPTQKFVDMWGSAFDMMHPTTDGFWEFLYKVYSKETIVRPEDKVLIGLMHTIGIIPGESFEPDENSRKLLDEAAVVGNFMMKNTAFNSPHKQNYIAYPDFSNWEFLFQTKNAAFVDEQGIPLIDQKNTFVHQAASTANGMTLKSVGKGSQYLATFRDGNGEWLDGSNLYNLHLPADVPVVNFWSVIVYDTETRSMINNGVQPTPGLNSLNADNYVQNSDGSFDLYFGPDAPEGYESNWLKTNEGDGFFLYFRFYGPTEAFFDKSWQLPNVELVK